MSNANQELLYVMKKLLYDNKKIVDPRFVREEDLLTQISNITNNETACRARNLFHSSKNVYDFDEYLFWLSELIELLLCGTSPEDAFDTVRCSIFKKHHEPLWIFNR